MGGAFFAGDGRRERCRFIRPPRTNCSLDSIGLWANENPGTIVRRRRYDAFGVCSDRRGKIIQTKIIQTVATQSQHLRILGAQSRSAT
jgi:hypothetical protein